MVVAPMITLVLDTTLNACTAAVADSERVLASSTEAMQRGHQERLAVMVQEVMVRACVPFNRLQRVGVTLGPGSFTGMRVGLAFAKGLSLALGAPLIGVGTLEALAAGLSGDVVASIDGKRDRIYLQLFREGAPISQAEAIDLAEVGTHLASFLDGSRSLAVVGPGSALLRAQLPRAGLVDRDIPDRDIPDPVALAELVRLRPNPGVRPKPLYLREPEAKTIAERAARGVCSTGAGRSKPSDG